jgi:ubiquitin carboxyl-terminal hydrolase 34
MDHETTELSRERAVSSEPCSTRANPYNNDDSSSRKRQRVSRGDSRSRSEETNGESSSAPPSTPPQDEERTKIELDTAPPHTPSRIQRDFPPPEPTSSRVTINLRTQRALEDIPSSPVSPPTPSKMVSGGEDSGTRVSVESESDALSTVPPIETPSSSPSPSGSPTIELIQISEDDAEYEEISPAVFDGSPVTGDPIFDFPYLENQSLVDAVRKIARFFQCGESFSPRRCYFS